jgi:hypothetical protein
MVAMSPECNHPSGSIDRASGLVVAVAAVHHQGTAEHQLAALSRIDLDGGVVDVDDLHRVAREGDADGACLVGTDHRVGARGAGELRHPPDLVDRATGARCELVRLGGRERLSADPAAGQARQVGPIELGMGE